jgi:pimeloyl-ACP methyl ester carboxylesterase
MRSIGGRSRLRRGGMLKAAIAGGTVLAGMALLNHRLSRRAECQYPRTGELLKLGAARLHVVRQGHGFPLVLLHGNGSWLDDFRFSGLIDAASPRYEVVAIDRPGFGYSNRPRGQVWSAARQADLVDQAMRELGHDRYLVLGHSWGALVAAECAIRHPRRIAGIVLVSGYLIPGPRVDALAFGLNAVPGPGTLVRHTILPVLSRLVWPAIMRRIFRPASPTPGFAAAARAIGLRPAQLRVAAAESALMIPAAARLLRQCQRLDLPVGIVAGADDAHVSTDYHSIGMHRRLPNSRLHVVPGAGHMVHHTAPNVVLGMVDKIAAAAGSIEASEALAINRSSPSDPAPHLERRTAEESFAVAGKEII